MFMLNSNDRLDALEQARDHLFEAMELIEAAVAGTPLADEADAYILAHLRDWVESEYEMTSLHSLETRLLELAGEDAAA